MLEGPRRRRRPYGSRQGVQLRRITMQLNLDRVSQVHENLTNIARELKNLQLQAYTFAMKIGRLIRFGNMFWLLSCVVWEQEPLSFLLISGAVAVYQATTTQKVINP